MKERRRLATGRFEIASGVLTASLVLSASWVASAQTPELAAAAEGVVSSLAARGVEDEQELLDALRRAWGEERELEYESLRSLGIECTDDEFDRATQNKPGRSSFHDPYGAVEWTNDVLRSFGREHPKKAFTWAYAVRSRLGFSTGEWQGFLRITTDWVRSGTAEAREAETQALALTDPTLRQEAIAGVIRGYILVGDGPRALELMEELTDERLRQDALGLYRRYVGSAGLG